MVVCSFRYLAYRFEHQRRFRRVRLVESLRADMHVLAGYVDEEAAVLAVVMNADVLGIGAAF